MGVFVFPFLAALLYSLSVLLAKFASNVGRMAPTSVLFLNNLAIWLVYLPFMFSPSFRADWDAVWKSLAIGVFFSTGNYATFLCAYKGELSLMTPVMGVKILFVLLFSRLLIGGELPGEIFASGVICCVAVFLLGASPGAGGNDAGKVKATYALAMCACASYAVVDVLFQKFSDAENPMVLLCISNFVPLLSSLPFLRRFARDLRGMEARPIVAGCLSALLMAGEATSLVVAITGGVGAALCNIFYNTRSLFSIALVFVLGIFYPQLRELRPSSAARRVVASFMILAAVAMVF